MMRRLKATLTKPALCRACGYYHDATETFGSDPHPPRRGDISLCLNCGIGSILDRKGWRPVTRRDVNKLTPEELRELRIGVEAWAEMKLSGEIGDLVRDQEHGHA